MQNRIEILNELKQVSPLLAGMEKMNVFTVPEGYFEGLSESILSVLKHDNPVVLQSINKAGNESVPAGYFESLADNILNKIKSAENKTGADELPAVLRSLQKINVYSVADGYFDTIEKAVVTKLTSVTAADELRTLSPMLYAIQDENVFEIPQGYFDKLSETILEKVKPQPAKLVAMRQRSNFFKYAAAAVVTGVMLFAGYNIVNRNSNEVSPSLSSVQQKGLEISKNGTFEKEMETISDEAILRYLQSNGENVDAALIASALDEKELPDQEDYLLDDKTLDNFLNNIEEDLKN